MSIVAVFRSTVVYKNHGCHPRKRRGASHGHVSTPLAPTPPETSASGGLGEGRRNLRDTLRLPAGGLLRLYLQLPLWQRGIPGGFRSQ